MLKFREATGADAVAISQLHTIETGRNSDINQLKSNLEKFPAVLVFDNQKLIAFAVSQKFAPDILELRNILVASDYQNQNIGSQLLKQIEEQSQPVYRSIILVNSQLYSAPNKRQAVSFYQQNGFSLVHSTNDTDVFIKSL